MAKFTSSGAPPKSDGQKCAGCGKQAAIVIVGALFIVVGLIGGIVTYNDADDVETTHEESRFQEYQVVSLAKRHRYCKTVDTAADACLPSHLIELPSCNFSESDFPIDFPQANDTGDSDSDPDSAFLETKLCRRTVCCVGRRFNDTTKECADLTRHYTTSVAFAGSCSDFTASLEIAEQTPDSVRPFTAEFQPPRCDNPRGCEISWESTLSVGSKIWLWADTSDEVSLEKPPDTTIYHWVPVWVFGSIFVVGIFIISGGFCRKCYHNRNNSAGVNRRSSSSQFADV